MWNWRNVQSMTTLTDEEKRVRDILIDRASHRQAIQYGELLQKAQIKLDLSMPYNWGVLGDILGHVATFEHEHGRPLLSCVAVRANFEHSDGFFKLADDLGFGDWKKLRKHDFDYTEMTRTFDYWQHNKI